ncbi:TPA: phage tail assembly protein T [Pseudomonas aeruginosa]
MCGIGGRTIAEAKSRLSYREFMSWCRFRDKRGSLHLGMRIERGTALLSALYANAHSKEPYKIYDFMPHEDEPVLSLEAALDSWG